MIKTALILLFREMECLGCITTFRDSKSYPLPPKLPACQKKNKEQRSVSQVIMTFFHFICQNTKNFIIALEIQLYSLFFFWKAGNLDGGGYDFESLKVVIHLRHSISLNSSIKAVFVMWNKVREGFYMFFYHINVDNNDIMCKYSYLFSVNIRLAKD